MDRDEDLAEVDFAAGDDFEFSTLRSAELPLRAAGDEAPLARDREAVFDAGFTELAFALEEEDEPDLRRNRRCVFEIASTSSSLRIPCHPSMP